MASQARAQRALSFMKQCRTAQCPLKPVQARHSSSAAAYSPSKFSKPLRLRPADSIASSPNSTSRTLPASSSPSSSASGIASSPESIPPPPTETRLSYRPSLWTSVKLLFGWQPPPLPPRNLASFTGINNPYRARTSWPPDFRAIHPKQQFHYEKTYRRRMKLKWARPTWNKSIRLVQHTVIVTTLVYFVFILEPGDGMGTPFDGFRVWFWRKVGGLGGFSEETRREIEELEKKAREEGKERKGLLR